MVLRLTFIALLFLTGCAMGGCAHAGIVPPVSATAPAVAAPYTFDIVGDDRNAMPWKPDFMVYAKLASEIAADKPAFVINVGDYTLAASDGEWAAFLLASKPITDTTPYFLTIGNHEIRTDAMEKIYLSRVHMPGNGLYYAFKAGPVLFIVLDSEQPGHAGKIEGAQLDWLKSVLADPHGATFKFVFLHRPLFPGLLGGHTLDSMEHVNAENLQSLLLASHVNAVFVGHSHLYARKTVGGVIHVITGGGGAPITVQESDGGFFEYVRASVLSDSVSFECIDINGKVRDGFTIGAKP